MSTSREPPTLKVEGGIASALSPEALRSLDSRALVDFLAGSRWYGGKGSTPASVRIAEVIPLDWGEDRAALVRVVLRRGDGTEESYQLPLTVREGEMSRQHVPPARAVLALVDADGVDALLYDALYDSGVRARLGAALERGATFEGDGARWTLTPVGAGTASLESLQSSLAPGEQSNSSVIYGDRAILKLFRRLEQGINPDVEITRFLTTRTTFRDTPELLAELSFESSSHGRSVAGMLTRFVAGAEDGWRYALVQLRSYLGAGDNGGDPSNNFARDASELGRITREMHRALASGGASDDPAFATRPVSGDDIARWAERTRRTVDSALDLLSARASSLEPRTAAMSRAIAGRRVAIHELLDEASQGARGARATEHGVESRTHGDYHLGQLLHASDGRWYVIDFEGEPARPLSERRELTSPARDLAGMLRSFGYAAATGAAEAGGLGTNPATEIRSAHWDRDVRAAFLDGYGADPSDPLIELFEMEKMFYELEYELNNRPDWVWVPLRAIARLF
jgi:maltose alpha-D-glucosyltransferase/alpha-amylase